MSLTESVCGVLARLGLHVVKVGHSASLSLSYTLKQTSTAGPGRFHYFLCYSGFVSASQPLLQCCIDTFPCTTDAHHLLREKPLRDWRFELLRLDLLLLLLVCISFYQKKNKKIQQRIPPPLLLLLLFTPSQAERWQDLARRCRFLSTPVEFESSFL